MVLADISGDKACLVSTKTSGPGLRTLDFYDMTLVSFA